MAEETNDNVIPSASAKAGTLRGRLREAKALAVASALTKGDSWVKDILGGKAGVMLDDIEPLLRTLGLKAVGLDKVCVDRKTAEAYETITKRAMAKESTLIWDDAE